MVRNQRLALIQQISSLHGNASTQRDVICVPSCLVAAAAAAAALAAAAVTDARSQSHVDLIKTGADRRKI